MIREQEKQFYQHKFQELTEADKFSRIHQKEVKLAAFHDLQQLYEKEQKVKSIRNKNVTKICGAAEINRRTKSKRDG